MNEVKITPIEIGNGVGFRGAVSISDEELKNRVDFLEQHTKEFNELVIKAENELYIRELLQRNENLKQELDQYKNILEDINKYIHSFKIENIGEKTMLILNDILLIKNGLGKDVIRLNKMKELEEE